MTEQQQNADLNALVIDLGRSLLQYVGEAWPWTDESSRDMQSAVDDLVARQAALVKRIVNCLAAGNWAVDLGIYPAEYTDLHYVSLDFLLAQLIHNADDLVAVIREIRRRISDDAAVAPLLSDAESDQQFIANKLRELAEPPLHEEEAAA